MEQRTPSAATIINHRLFRPWDNLNKTNLNQTDDVKNDSLYYQDCTISTTSDGDPIDQKCKCDSTETMPHSNSDTESSHKHHEIRVPLISPISQITANSQQQQPHSPHQIQTNITSQNNKQYSINTQTRKSKSKYKSRMRNHGKRAAGHAAKNDLLPRHHHHQQLSEPNAQKYLGTDAVYPSLALPMDAMTNSPFHNEMLAHSLNMTSTDPILLESLAHGYAIEEYARILSQEHHAKLVNNRKQRPKKYKCPHCDVGFSNNGQLKGHIRIHTGERPFRCDDKNCGKTFTRNEELTRHKRIHSGLRPYPCATCGKRFGRKDHLKKHARTHMASRTGLQLVPVVLPAGAWAAIPPTAGLPAYQHHHHNLSSALPPSQATLAAMLPTPYNMYAF